MNAERLLKHSNASRPPYIAYPSRPRHHRDLGERASYLFFEFFTGNIRNPNTRGAYARAAVEFFDWRAA
jgi:hypothetical protein